MATAKATNVYDLGTVEYQQAWAMQRDMVQQRIDGVIEDSLLLLEHPHVYTLGRRGKMGDVLLSADELNKAGIAVHKVDRGGEVTYHGPGQLVVYPILDLSKIGGPVHYVHSLEAALKDGLAVFGISAHVRDGFPGVWIGEGEQQRKIAAIGVRISHGVSCHGFALNISTDLTYFRHIVACGIFDLKVTSIERELCSPVDAVSVRKVIVSALEVRLGLVAHWEGE